MNQITFTVCQRIRDNFFIKRVAKRKLTRLLEHSVTNLESNIVFFDDITALTQRPLQLRSRLPVQQLARDVTGNIFRPQP